MGGGLEFSVDRRVFDVFLCCKSTMFSSHVVSSSKERPRPLFVCFETWSVSD